MSEELKLVLVVAFGLIAGMAMPFGAAKTIEYFSSSQPYPTVCHNKVEYFLDGGIPSHPVIDPSTMKPQRCERLPLEKP